MGEALGVATSGPATPVLGLIVLMIAFLLVMTRVSLRRPKKVAAGLVPEITPAPTPTPAAQNSVGPAGQAAGVIASPPAKPGPGLIALMAAFLLVLTRLFGRRRTNGRRPEASR